MRTRTREQWNHTLAEKPCQPFTRPRVYPLQSFTNFESLSPVAVSCSAFQQAFHFKARCRELRKRGSILRDSRRCGNPFFQLFLKDGASLHVQGSSIRKASIVFPVQLYASTILPSIERISSCALHYVIGNEASAAIGPITSLLRYCTLPIDHMPKNKSGEGPYAFPRLHANQTMLSRIYSV